MGAAPSAHGLIYKLLLHLLLLAALIIDAALGQQAAADTCVDLDNSGMVDVSDLLACLAAYGTSADGDADGDGDTVRAQLRLPLPLPFPLAPPLPPCS